MKIFTMVEVVLEVSWTLCPRAKQEEAIEFGK